MPSVSIITPVYNNFNLLFDTIRSVQKQTYQDYELLIIDDCSTEEIPQTIINLINSDSRLHLIKRDWNAGPAVTRNRGISMAKGRYIAFLDADDTWHPEKLSIQIRFMKEKNIAVSYTAYSIINESNNLIGKRTPPSKLSYTDILKCNQIGCLTGIYDTKSLGKMFMPNIAKRQDMGLWLQILKKVDNAYGIVNQPLAYYRVGNHSVSSNKLSVLKYQWRIYREVEKLSIVKSAFYFFCYTYNGLKRKS